MNQAILEKPDVGKIRGSFKKGTSFCNVGYLHYQQKTFLERVGH